MDSFTLDTLPPKKDLETKRVLKKLASAHRYLAELKGVAETIPNEEILINTLTLQEAKDSSEIENIITSHDELYKTTLFSDFIKNPAAKEVNNYADALRKGFSLVIQNDVLTVNHVKEIHQILENNDAGIRKLPGTELQSDRTGKTIYVPPQDYREIVQLMDNLELFINDDSIYDADYLTKMAIIHLQFESIHPFYDGNGRAGRMINVLYLVAKGLLDLPVLYLSRYIIENKSEYYRLLQDSRISGDWEDWIIYILEGIETTSLHTISLIRNIKEIMLDYKHRIREELPKIYSQDLINNLFGHPYTKIDYIKTNLRVSRITATKYLEQLTEAGFLQKHKEGRYNYYINMPLVALLLGEGDK
jgi:cell filamentation protein, protein adenylyltransferase